VPFAQVVDEADSFAPLIQITQRFPFHVTAWI
jgi:hypothetical protein